MQGIKIQCVLNGDVVGATLIGHTSVRHEAIVVDNNGAFHIIKTKDILKIGEDE